MEEHRQQRVRGAGGQVLLGEAEAGGVAAGDGRP